MAAVTCATARSKASDVAAEVDCTPLTLRTYWRAAASISSPVADGSSPRSVVMFLHMARDATSEDGPGPVDLRAVLPVA